MPGRSRPNLRFRDGRFQCQLVPPVPRGNERNCAISVVSACPQKQFQLAAHFRHGQAADRRELITYRQSRISVPSLACAMSQLISFSQNAASYFPRPRLRSQLATSMTVPKLSSEAHHRPGERHCPGHRAWARNQVALRRSCEVAAVRAGRPC